MLSLLRVWNQNMKLFVIISIILEIVLFYSFLDRYLKKFKYKSLLEKGSKTVNHILGTDQDEKRKFQIIINQK